MWEEYYSFKTNDPVSSTNKWHRGRGKKGGNMMGTGMDLRVVWPNAEYGS